MERWINIDEKLPPQNSDVLVYSDPGNGGFGITLCTYSDGIFRFQESDRENKSDITFWCDLPAPPWAQTPGEAVQGDTLPNMASLTEWRAAHLNTWEDPIGPNASKNQKSDI